jgi:uncharacterized protein (TIGR03437 family)
MFANVEVRDTAPALFSANMTGGGPAAAWAYVTEADGRLRQVAVSRCVGPALCFTEEIEIGNRPVYLSLFGTGIRNRTSLDAVTVWVGSRSVPVLYAGAQPEFAGLDQINVLLPRELRGAGETDVIVTIGLTRSNAVRIRID